MNRLVEPELLDQLPPEDPRARRSRKDLCRVNRLMGNARILANALKAEFPKRESLSLLELGAGDGLFLLSVCRIVGGGGFVTLLDRQALIEPSTQQAFGALGWKCASVRRDLLDWIAQEDTARFDAIVANLFLHHFSEETISPLFRKARTRASIVIAVEPRRSAFALGAGRLLGWVGCNEVTRHDAVASIRAGFENAELSSLWKAENDWLLEERPAGLFSHLFIARRRPAARAE